mmetsp:Transcript_17936/g.69484  ORF Transcript_17936/g.69484 Transcript_17936/m.69484 type:complete len:1045 (-) Transcript_17936:34-3168(-)
MIRPVLPVLPQHALLDVVEQIMLQMKHAGGAFASIIRKQGFGLLKSLLSHDLPEESAAAVAAAFLQDAEQLQPAPQEQEQVVAFGPCVAAAVEAAHKGSPTAAMALLAKWSGLLLDYLPASKDAVFSSVSSAVERMIEATIDEGVLREASANKEGDCARVLLAFISRLTKALGYQYQEAWGFVLVLHSCLYRALGPGFGEWLAGALHVVCELAQDRESPHNSAAELALAAAINGLGVDEFLSVLPLNFGLAVEDENRREWLLPVLRAHVCRARLATFGQTLLPLANQIKEQGLAARREDRPVQAKHCAVLYHQIWSLLPAFCNLPTDTVENFRHLAKVIGGLLASDQSLQIIICNALQALIQNFQKVIDSQAVGDDDEEEGGRRQKGSFKDIVAEVQGDRSVPVQEAYASLKAVAAFSKNFLPILFNIFKTQCHSNPNKNTVRNKAVLLNTIEAFVLISPPDISNTFFKEVMTKLLAASSAEEQAESAMSDDTEDAALAVQRKQKQVLTDLAVVFIRRLSDANIEFLYKVIKPQISSSKDATLQKKSYKVLKNMCAHRKEFVQAHTTELLAFLFNTLAKSSASSKKGRLRCLRHLVANVDRQSIMTLARSPLVAEVVLCVKEPNAKARAEAYALLVDIARAATGVGSLSVTEFLSIVAAGLAGTTPHMISATVQSLARYVHVFRNRIDLQFLTDLLESVLLLFTSRSREIVKSCLSFAKVAAVSYPVALLEDHLAKVVGALLIWANDTKNRFRLKVRVVLERLIKKYGYERIEPLIPEDQHKFVANIHKGLRGAETKKKARPEQADDMDLDDEAAARARGAQRTWIADAAHEDADIVDFLDPAAARHISSTNPKRHKAVVDSDDELEDFDEDGEGRWIIEDEELLERQRQQASREKEATPPRMSVYDLIEDQLEKGKITKKRAKRLMEQLEDKDSDEEEEEDETEVGGKRRRGGAAAAAGTKRRKTGKQMAQKGSKYSGSEYAAKKGGGDAKRDGRYEPFAYQRLDPKMLNKRHKGKSKQQFDSVIRSAKKGAKAKRQPARRRP